VSSRCGAIGLAAWLSLLGGVSLAGAADMQQNNTAAPLPAARSMAIEIVSANYGHSGAPNSCVVTPSLKRSCNGRSRCLVTVSDRLCPAPGAVPMGLVVTLSVQYKCTPGVMVRAVTADRPFQVIIDCGAKSP
jgi:hypothetical protein